MADVYCDQALGSGNDDGTSWINAYRLLATALNGSNVVAGDILWVKGNVAAAGTVTLKGVATFTNDPPQVIACKSGTSNTPPVQADLIPGLRTGQSVLAYDDADAPTLSQTGAAESISLQGYMRMYGMVLKARDNFQPVSSESSILLEECVIRSGDGELGQYIFGHGAASLPSVIILDHCKISAGSGGLLVWSSKNFLGIFRACIIDVTADPMIEAGAGSGIFEGCDFSSQTGAILTDSGGLTPQARTHFLNCKINASSALVSGSITEKFRTEFIHTSSVTGKTTGQTFQEIDIITDNGNIVEETTRFRTGGADDGGSGAWSLAFTPNVNGTRDNREGLISPWFHQKIAGDGTAQTLTVFIANSSASTDYQDDEVWLEVFYPSEVGTADYDAETTQMDLSATPSNVTDDTGSVWGSGANNHQKLSVSIAPDYTGRLRWRVVFAKNFGASPETLYVDPKSVLT